MEYRCFVFRPASEELLALLSLFGFEAFEETGDAILAYIAGELCDDLFYSDLDKLCKSRDAFFEESRVEDINWNEKWESSFPPVVVGDFCVVKASFHQQHFHSKYIITIDPKMAFGTGHHETTYMMIEWLQEIPMKHKTVLDHGCGTGVLAILAEKCGAKSIDALDIDENAISNTIENCHLNHCLKVSAIVGDIGQLHGRKYDVILANINRNVLLDSCQDQFDLLRNDGLICLSGLLRSDKEIIESRYLETGLRLAGTRERGGWLSLLFIRQ